MRTTTVQPAARHDAPTQSQGYIPIALDTLIANGSFVFDLYLHSSESRNYRLYRAKHYPLLPRDIEKLRSQGVHTLHILFDDRNRYADYVHQLLQGNALPAEQKYNLLKGAARSLLSDTLQTKTAEVRVDTIDALSQKIVNSLCDDDLVMRDMFFLMTHDYCSYTHSINVCTYCVQMARHIGLNDEKTLQEIATGALLHDLGKRHLPPAILNKSGWLDAREVEIMQTHPQLGFDELAVRNDLNPGQLMMVYQHHERLDGIGYPLHATNREIHPWAKLCAVADVFDAITSHRAYRGPKSCSEALAVLEVGAGSAFDAEFVHCLSAVMQGR